MTVNSSGDATSGSDDDGDVTPTSKEPLHRPNIKLEHLLSHFNDMDLVLGVRNSVSVFLAGRKVTRNGGRTIGRSSKMAGRQAWRASGERDSSSHPIHRLIIELIQMNSFILLTLRLHCRA